MVKKTASRQKQRVKTSLIQLPTKLLWLYAISSIVIIPIVYYSLAIDRTLIPKQIALILLLLLFSIIFIIQPKFNLPEAGLLSRWSVLSWLTFLLISIISLFGALNPVEGLSDIIRILVEFLFLILTTSILINTKNIKPFILAVAFLAVIYLSIGFYQYFTFAFRAAYLDSLYKVVGIWTHKNVFASVFYLMIPFFIFEILTANKSRKVVFAVILFLILVLIFLLQTRSIWVALFINLMICSFLIIIFRRGIFSQILKPNFFQGLIYIGISLFLGLFFAWLITNYSINNPSHHSRSVSQGNQQELNKIDKRVASIFNAGEANRNQRLMIWKMTSKMILEHPFTGVGSGNWKILIPSYFEKDYNKYFFNNWRTPHNDFIWVLAEKGVLGLLSYLAFFVFLLIYALKVLQKNIDPEKKVLVITLIAGLAGYCGDALFSFPSERIENQVFMMLYASGIIWVYSITFPLKKPVKKNYSRLFSAIAIALLVIAFIFNKIWLKEEVYTNMAYSARNEGKWQEVIDLINEGSTSINQLDARNASILWFRGNAYLQLNKLDLAAEDLEKALEQNPNTIMVLTDLGIVYMKQAKYPQAIEMFNNALKIYPNFRDAMVNLGLTYYKIGKYQDALDNLNKCKTNKENIELDNFIEKVRMKLNHAD